MNNNIKKTKWIIKKTKILFFVSLFLLYLPTTEAIPLSNYAQTQNFTINFEKKTIQEVFTYIEQNSEFVFLFYADILDTNKKVNVSVKNESIQAILNQILKNTQVTYEIKDRQIILVKKAKQSDPATPAVTKTQQQKKVTGKVVDETGESLPGVAIQVKGTPRGVTTDIDGSFSIDVKNTDVLVFTYLGMEDQSVTVDKKNVLTIVMKTKADELEGVEVVAFAKQKKESVLGAISTIKPAELKIPSSNLTTSFAGRIAGVISYQRSGEPGQDNAEFFIRGVTTFGTGKADPLILIDNIELSANDLARVSPDDIASFSVLKDATATALYGARGANGVILVTTKEGKEGKVSVSFRIENSLSAPVKEVELSDPLTFMKLHNESVRTRDPLGDLPYLDSEIAAREEGRNPYVYPVVDWKKMLIKDYTMNQRGNLSLSGGGKVARYYVALTYSRDNGILKSDPENNFDNNIQINKYSVRSNVNLNLTKTTELGVRVSGTFDDSQSPQSVGGMSGGQSMYNNAIKASPVLFPAFYKPDKANMHTKHILFGNYGQSFNYMNPYAEMLKGYTQAQRTVINAQLELKQNLEIITEGLKFRLMGNVTRNSSFDMSRGYNPFYYSIGAYDKMTDIYKLNALNPDVGTDYLNFKEGGKGVSGSLYLESSLSYDRVFNDIHSISGMLVYMARESLDANAGSLEKSLPSRNLGLSGRFTYGLLDRYYTEFNFGYNGSERFDKNNRWGFFPSAGLGWVVSKEGFWEDSFLSKYVQMLKFKGSYGIVGNDNIADDRFFYLSQVNMNDDKKKHSFGTEFNESSNGITISRYADPKIGWEISHKLNLGFETKLFNSLEIQAEYFHEKRTNILQERADIPSLIGLQVQPKANIGEALGGGVDISVDYNKIINKDLWITARGNFTYASSEFSIYEEPDYSMTTPWKSKVGQKLSQKYGLIAERLFIDEQDVLNSPRQQFGDYMAGDIKYKDINNDGLIDNQDEVPIGYPTTPEIIYGFGISAGYKDFDFSCFFQGSARSSFWIDPEAITPFVNSIDKNIGKIGNNAVMKFIEEDHWSETDPNAYALWPRLSSYAVGNNNKRSTWWMRNGNFLRLKSAEVGYTLPAQAANKIKMANLRVYLSGSNLFCLSNFKLWDPEMGGNGLGYPVQRVFNVGLQVSF